MCNSAIVRMASPEWDELRSLAFSRYPNYEWATFARFGWRKAKNRLVLTLAHVDGPQEGDLDSTVGNVAFQEQYTLRTALAAEKHCLGVGVIHSHPEGCRPVASWIDDDMDSYYSGYFGEFAPGRPYASLIISIVDDELAVSGRVWWRDRWLAVEKFAIERTPCRLWVHGASRDGGENPRERTERLSGALGLRAEARLRNSTVAVIGAGGTGSAAIEVLARAGIGRLIIVDPDVLSESNLERVHGSGPEDLRTKVFKVKLAEEHVHSIDPSCVVEGYVGSLPQEEIIDAVVTADVALGCTDQQHSRLALSDIAMRFLIPSLDCGVSLEGQDGRLTGQIIQFVRFLPADPCALCRHMINPSQVAQELMTVEERDRRRDAARRVSSGGKEARAAYWEDIPQLNTVGYLTTSAGAMLAGYAIGWLTGVAEPPFERLQLNLGAPFFDVTDQAQQSRADCSCCRVRGWADQGRADALITAPRHWPPVQLMSEVLG
jgi:molybdopterin/thiamine biosynthesis adenylyltransferase